MYLKEVEKVFQGTFKDVFLRLKVVKESVNCVSRKFHKKFQGFIKNL